MTKADIVEILYARGKFTKLTKKDASEVVELMLDAVKEALERGDQVKLSGFGLFQVKERPARHGRDPNSGRPLDIAPRRGLSFRPSELLKEALNAPAKARAAGQAPRRSTGGRVD
ncbi:MAG: integration host factor subunit alpha [Pseudomonadota bacterium]|jgi:integration host factor subunit alpha